MNRLIFSLAILSCLSALVGAAPNHSNDGPTLKVRTVDDATHTGKLTALKDGQLILSGPTTRISLTDVLDITSSQAKSVAAEPHGPVHKLTGKVIGTQGSFKDSGSTGDKAFDGNLNTFFDPPADKQDGAWVGLDLGSAKLITQVKFAPRGRFPDRMVDGMFQASDSPEFEKDVVTFFTITEPPQKDQLTTKDVHDTHAYRYVRYTGGQTLNVAELEFWGRDIGDSASPDTKPSVATSGPAAAPVVLRALFSEDDQIKGNLSSWDDKTVSLQSKSIGDTPVDIPVASLREVWLGSEAQSDQAKAMPLESGPQDAAFVSKEGSIVVVRGVVLGVEADALKFKFNDQERKIKLDKLVGVIFGGLENKKDHSFRQKLDLANNNSISGRWTGYDAAKNSIELQTPWGESVSIPLASVQKIRSANGRLTYLSDLKPSGVEQAPYFDRLMPYQVNQSLTGAKLKLADGEHDRGIAVHSRCVLTYDLDAAYESFKVKVGFQQPEGKLGDAPIRIVGDGKVLWQDAHARGDAAAPAAVSVAVAGVKQLSLEVDFGDNGDTGGRVDWVDARLLRALSVP